MSEEDDDFNPEFDTFDGICSLEDLLAVVKGANVQRAGLVEADRERMIASIESVIRRQGVMTPQAEDA